MRSITTTGNELLAVFEKITGGEAWTKEYTTNEKELKEGKDLLAKGETEAGMFKLIRVVLFGEDYGGDFDASAHVWNKELGLPEGEDLESIVRQFVDGKLH